MATSGRGLGRRLPADWRHVERYPLRGLPDAQRPVGVPVAIGVNWYAAFSAPEKRGSIYQIPDTRDLGPILGGHALVLEPFDGPKDLVSWWAWHDQVSEGICVSEAVVRLAALLNRKRYQPRPVYDDAQRFYDAWPGESPSYEGTSVRAGLEVARLQGLIPARRGESHQLVKGVVTRPFVPAEGIAAYRWALTVDEVFAALGRPDAEYAVWLNSWGRSYPHRVRVSRRVLERLLSEDGEFGLVTDR